MSPSDGPPGKPPRGPRDGPPHGHPENDPGRRGPGGSGKGAAAARRRAVRIALCHELIRAGAILERRGMVVATEGNLSARFDLSHVVITRRGRRKGELTPRDFVEMGLVEPEDSVAREAASTEHRVHLAAYGARDDVEAVVHAHPVALTAFGLRGALPDFAAFDEARGFIGAMALVPYFPSGSDALANAVGLALLGEATARKATPPGVPAKAPAGAPNVVLLRHHGAVAVGETVDQALSRLEIAEHLAATLLLAERTRS
jgi:L-fuculose-phosphate aldolase